MKYKCIIVDDEEPARDLIKNHLSKFDDFEIVATCNNAIEVSNILLAKKVDLIFLDIEMPVLKGTDLLKNLLIKPKVIFTTAYRNYAVEGFDLDAVDFLLKPIIFERFYKSIQKFIEQTNNHKNIGIETSKDSTSDFIFVTEKRKKIKLLFNDILYIESLKDYIKIHTQKKTHTIKYSISAFQKELDTRFVRVHRSYIVNKNMITAYTKNDVELDTIEIPISDNYRKDALNRISK